MQAFAFPELTTIARAAFRAADFALSLTGAAHTRFVVNIPATAAGTSETIIARSGFRPFSEPLPVPSVLMLQNTAADRNPAGAQIDPDIWRNAELLGVRFTTIPRSPENRTSD